MTLIYIHSKFPKTRKGYNQAADDNTKQLKEIMSKLTLAQSEPAETPPRQGRAGAQAFKPSGESWAYTDRARPTVQVGLKPALQLKGREAREQALLASLDRRSKNKPKTFALK